MRDELYYGLARIAKRLGVSKAIARSLIDRGIIRAKKSSKAGNAPWFTTESRINEDIKSLPNKL